MGRARGGDGSAAWGGGGVKRKTPAHKMAMKWQVPADDKGTGKEYTGIVAKWAKGRPLFREI